MDDENVASSTAPPVEAAEGDGGTKCSVCKKRVGRKSECNLVNSVHTSCAHVLFLTRNRFALTAREAHYRSLI